MKAGSLALFIFGWSLTVSAQTRWVDRNGHASFFSSAPMEDIEAHNNQVASMIDTGAGEIVVSMLMRSFDFRKALMEEHFNENYVESNKYPKAVFKGKIVNLSRFDASKDGKYSLDVEGEITLHGVTRPLKVTAEAIVQNGAIKAKAVFPLVVKDFKIQIPRLVRSNIAEEVKVTVSFDYKPA
jgi:polyisoprenoid-binding protein YceI